MHAQNNPTPPLLYPMWARCSNFGTVSAWLRALGASVKVSSSPRSVSALTGAVQALRGEQQRARSRWLQMGAAPHFHGLLFKCTLLHLFCSSL